MICNILHILLEIITFPLTIIYLLLFDLFSRKPNNNNNIPNRTQIYCPVVRLRLRSCILDHDHFKCTEDNNIIVRVLLDTGTGPSIISNRIVRLLKLNKFPLGIEEGTENQLGRSSTVVVNEAVQVGFESLDNPTVRDTVQLVVFPLDTITVHPKPGDAIRKLSKDLSVELSDIPGYEDSPEDNPEEKPEDSPEDSDEIDILIGQDLYNSVFLLKHQESIFVEPNMAFVPTRYGYVLQGGQFDVPELVSQTESWFPLLTRISHRFIDFLFRQRASLCHRLHVPGSESSDLLLYMTELKIHPRNNITNLGREIQFVYMPTLRIVARNPLTGNSMIIRALIDSGSTMSIISSRVVRELELGARLIRPQTAIGVQGLPYCYLTKSVQLYLEALEEQNPAIQHLIELNVQPNDRIPRFPPVPRTSFESLARSKYQIHLNDSSDNLERPIQAMIGQDLLTGLLLHRVQDSIVPKEVAPVSNATFVPTKLGWILQGVCFEFGNEPTNRTESVQIDMIT